MHQVQSMSTRSPILIQFRYVSCVCMGCVDKNSKLECELVSHVLGWMLSRLVPKDQIQVRATMLQQNDDGEIEVQTKRDEIANDVQVVKTLQFDQMMLMIHFGSCWLPNVYM